MNEHLHTHTHSGLIQQLQATHSDLPDKTPVVVRDLEGRCYLPKQVLRGFLAGDEVVVIELIHAPGFERT